MTALAWLDATWPGSTDPAEAFRQTIERRIHARLCPPTHAGPYINWPCRTPLAESEAIRDAARAAG